MGSPDKCIIGVDETEGLFLANVMREELKSADPVISFSVESVLKGSNWSIFVNKGFLAEWRNGRQVASIDLRTKLNLVGRHNHQNICAAYGCCRALGLSPRKIEQALETFTGLRHRAQVLGKKYGVLFVNDSKATTCVSASKSLQSFKNIHWIVGGEEKEPGIEALMPISEDVKGIYLIGSSESSFSAKLGQIKHKRCQSLDKALKCAFQNTSPGDTILLAPACASFDQFKSFEDRGDKFIEFFENIEGFKEN
jgi:UDP-N-acetylmuramoylalanine--D-glutamate ligase